MAKAFPWASLKSDLVLGHLLPGSLQELESTCSLIFYLHTPLSERASFPGLGTQPGILLRGLKLSGLSCQSQTFSEKPKVEPWRLQVKLLLSVLKLDPLARCSA
jgi:hypothetical protein